MRRVRLFSLLQLLLVLPAGCQAPLPNTGVGSGRSLIVELDAQRHVQATVSRNLTSMLDHFGMVLLKWDGDSFEPLPIPLTATTSELNRPKFAFNHLGAGRYQVKAVGYDAANVALTSEGTAEIDLTGNDLALDQHVTVPLTMLPKAFSATLALPSNTATPGSVPVWATGLEAVVSVGGTEIARHSYTPTQTPELKNLSAGVTYDVTVTASDGLGYSDDATVAYFADPSAASLDDAPAQVFAWTPRVTTYAVGAYPRTVALDAGSNAWVINSASGSVSRISVTGSLSTFSVGSSAMDVVVDGADNVWVANYGSHDVTRISSTGSISTYPGGTQPWDLAVDGAGNVWVANISSANVTRISSTGDISTFTVGGFPRAVVTDAAGNAWVVSSGNDCVTRISSTGAVTPYAVGANPGNVAMDGAGNAWVVNNNSNNVTRVSSTGVILTYTVGTTPSDVAMDGYGNAWVANYDSGNVTRISSTGVITTCTVGTNPRRLAVDASGIVWVANFGSDSASKLEP